MSSNSHSITGWIDKIRSSDPEAARILWSRFFQQMILVARNRLGSLNRAPADEEDVAIKAFTHFWNAAQQGKFPHLQDRDDLWAVLFTITDRVACGQVRHERRLKRGGRGDVQQQIPLDDCPEIIDGELLPDEMVLIQEELQHLLTLLLDPELREIALLKFEGYTNVEIAERLGWKPVTIERRLRLIRQTWQTLALDASNEKNRHP